MLPKLFEISLSQQLFRLRRPEPCPDGISSRDDGKPRRFGHQWLSGRPPEFDIDLAGRSRDIWALLGVWVVLAVAVAVAAAVLVVSAAVARVAVAAVPRQSAGIANNLDTGAKSLPHPPSVTFQSRPSRLAIAIQA